MLLILLIFEFGPSPERNLMAGVHFLFFLLFLIFFPVSPEFKRKNKKMARYSLLMGRVHFFDLFVVFDFFEFWPSPERKLMGRVHFLIGFMCVFFF